MKVVCINAPNVELGCAILKKGNIYTVIDHAEVKGFKKGRYTAVDGVYYKLIEANGWYHSSSFVHINENQQDETEFKRIYNEKEKV